jgi:hypothetical protein
MVQLSLNNSKENLQATIASTVYDRSKTTGECGIFQLFGVTSYKVMYRVAEKSPYTDQYATINSFESTVVEPY